MNKNLKKIIAIGLMLGSISTVRALAPIGLLTKAAYAAPDNNQVEELTSLRVETQGGTGIKLYYDDSYKNYNKVNYDDVESDHIYYAETSADTIKLEPDGPDSKYVKVFNGTSDSAKGEAANSDIKLLPGTNIITVRVYKEEPDKYVEYEDRGKAENSYILNINYNPNSSVDEDDINLKSLTVDKNKISLSDSQAVYTYNTADDVKSVSIEAKPEDDDYKVTIDGDEVDDGDDYKKDISLDNGENDIKIEIEDDNGDDKEYILNINKGESSLNAGTVNETGSAVSANTQSSNPVHIEATASQNNTTITVIKANQWIQVSGKWQYADLNGNPIKNQWFFDKNYGKWYYLGVDGFMAENCWMLSEGKYYYLTGDGSMAVNTIINGYKVGADGAWIS
ncbi:cadherin-like beta sandwich domain-containing protein [Clostridium sp. BL-8]|uniref:cadherin-like beta sandwich domain-containing protein n=1 Tax=Clostridium sp. BL-8 TaxID=349938 RepID=UPI00098CCD4B|nr:cadherin-like beta sandwich domain-containing protein [Clostridium sp. BL-8]OOM71286.1 putative endo-beta-N-acetylglucosaminidase precursor [Clostridium sp. BL-8]